MATKPTTSTEWAIQFTTDGGSGNPNKQVPTETFKNFGQPEAIPTDRQSLNYQLNSLHLWKEYFEESTDDIFNILDGTGVFEKVSTNTTIFSNKSFMVDTSSNDVNILLQSSADTTIGDTFTIKHLKGSSNVCKIINNGYTIKGLGDYDIGSGDNIIVDGGDVVTFLTSNNNELTVKGVD